MKTKKHSKKNRNTHHNSGRIVLDENTIENFFVLKRETAFEQLMDAICQFSEKGEIWVCDMSCFNGHEDELEEVMEKVRRFRARMSQKAYWDCSGSFNKIA